MHVDPEQKDNGTDVIDEYERKENKKRGRKKKKDKEKGDAEPTRKKETKLIDFD